MLRNLSRWVCRAEFVADLGCGFGTTFSETLQLCSGHNGVKCLGVDMFFPALAEAKSSGRIAFPVMADLRILPIACKSIDVSLLVDVIEHFDKDQAEQVLAEAERITRHTIVVVTPHGFMEQGEADGNLWQQHRSGWTVHDLRSLGFAVEGVDVSLDSIGHKFGLLGRVIASVGELLLGGLRIFPARWSTMLFSVMQLGSGARW